ncbi:metallophosphoesterase [Fibrella sp. HMF5405]|uniref:Metallophosphoesterase n=1 Tax=Fibrella forsythiae TaxID=2817061 RepID=A0ABS3JMF3_9BACT|nr:metallophosphoesterase [Fibrella forsythiae]
MSKHNQQNLNVYYLDALITDLKIFHLEEKIDVILITGDLVDKGGESLGDNPYKTFSDTFIIPICDALSIQTSQVLFIPGNHDIERHQVLEDNEYFLSGTLTKDKANSQLDRQRDIIQPSNKRIERFKIFEREFHKDTPDYSFSFNESIAVKEIDGAKVGFLLINDSWRCSSSLSKEQHFVGTNQLKNAKSYFDTKKTDLNIVLFHHPLEEINSLEKEDFENLLQAFHFNIAFFGHSHSNRFESINSANGGVVYIKTRSTFNDPDELNSRYQPGYLIVDINIQTQRYILYARKFITSRIQFDKDADSLTDGKVIGMLDKQKYVNLNEDIKTEIIDLPSGYRADVNKVVKLLIGKSLYPDSHIFVRELIQNSVDACNRQNEQYPYLAPKIIVYINTLENSFEIIDEGDGMSKKVLREHFSIVGKSISQEFTESLNSVNLISQFGIGFISTFIVSRKINVSTKSQEDGLINFEIEDVFKGFDYNAQSSMNFSESQSTGTSIKVYLKSPFQAYSLLSYIKTYCRHVDNLTCHFDGSLQPIQASWNLEGGFAVYERKTSKYECKLTIGNTGRYIIATNSGFLINESPSQIIPYKFPFVIGGEVVFEPRSIDFDLSRTNIMHSEKSLEFKRFISASLRYLFRSVLESYNSEMKIIVVRYLQYYLVSYEDIIQQVTETYNDFYSKNELIQLCSQYTFLEFKSLRKPLNEILIILNSVNISKVYYYQTENVSDLALLIASFLKSNGNLVFSSVNLSALFREGSLGFNMTQVVNIIASVHGISLVHLNDILYDEVNKVLIDRSSIPAKVSGCIDKLEKKYSIKISLAHFGADYRLFLNNGEVNFINCDHASFADLVSNIDHYNDITLEVFMLGVLGRSLSSASINNGLLDNTYPSNN